MAGARDATKRFLASLGLPHVAKKKKKKQKKRSPDRGQDIVR